MPGFAVRAGGGGRHALVLSAGDPLGGGPVEYRIGPVPRERAGLKLWACGSST